MSYVVKNVPNVGYLNTNLKISRNKKRKNITIIEMHGESNNFKRDCAKFVENHASPTKKHAIDIIYRRWQEIILEVQNIGKI